MSVITLAAPAESPMTCAPPPWGCGGTVEEFRDEESLRRWTMTGRCQYCQDAADGEEEEE